jgi:hypothetical protein
MATYIEDEETSTLIAEYADRMHTSKTGALRELLKRELAGLDRRATAQARYAAIMEWLGPPAERQVEEIPKEYFDWLAGDPQLPQLSDALKKELGVE